MLRRGHRPPTNHEHHDDREHFIVKVDDPTSSQVLGDHFSTGFSPPTGPARPGPAVYTPPQGCLFVADTVPRQAAAAAPQSIIFRFEANAECVAAAVSRDRSGRRRRTAAAASATSARYFSAAAAARDV